MADVTLTEEQFATMQRGMALLQQLSTKPETKREFERVVKRIVPDMQTTDDIAEEVAAPYLAKVEEITQRFSQFIDTQEERDRRSREASENAELSARFARLRDKEGLQERGEQEVRQLMIDRNIPDPEAAFALWERNNPKTVETTSSWEPDSWNIDQNAVGPDTEALFKSPDRWADTEAAKVLNEMRRGNQI